MTRCRFTEARRSDVKADFNAGRALPDPFNVGDNYGGLTISVNNQEMFVTVCAAPDAKGYRDCDIFRSHYETKFDLDKGGQTFEWAGLENLGPNINTPDGWESQPSLSADGNTLYYATIRPITDGIDIFESKRDGTGQWSPARPVKGINTTGDEKAPFMHSDSRTLYFAAKPPTDESGRVDEKRGHRGIGGYDIFFSKLNDDGTWTKPKNLGHPLNTDQDEHGLIVAELALDPLRLGYVYVARGMVHANGRLLAAGDAAMLDGEARLVIDRGREAEVLVFDLAR